LTGNQVPVVTLYSRSRRSLLWTASGRSARRAQEFIQGVGRPDRPEREGETYRESIVLPNGFAVRLGIIAVLGLVFAIALPAFANDLHQAQDISWDNSEFQGSADECRMPTSLRVRSSGTSSIR
jgi:hypothetical protein